MDVMCQDGLEGRVEGSGGVDSVLLLIVPKMVPLMRCGRVMCYGWGEERRKDEGTVGSG